jgi:signal peptidase I
MYSDAVKNILVKLFILEKGESPKSFLFWILSVIVIVRILQVFVFQPFIVDGGSMTPTFTNNDMLIIDKVSYKISEPHRGDVVVFKFHQVGSSLDGKYFLKRLIGLPGDTITIDNTNTTITTKDGTVLHPNESFVKLPTLSQHVVVTLKDDEYFVMGDNRAGSYDSRYWGPVHKSQFSGRAVMELYNNISINPGAVAY